MSPSSARGTPFVWSRRARRSKPISMARGCWIMKTERSRRDGSDCGQRLTRSPSLPTSKSPGRWPSESLPKQDQPGASTINPPGNLSSPEASSEGDAGPPCLSRLGLRSLRAELVQEGARDQSYRSDAAAFPDIAVRESSVAAPQRTRDHRAGGSCHDEVATTFLTLGAVSYGGAGILGMMQAEIQQKRGWLSKKRFLDGLALSNLLPGPTAAQLAMFLGYARAGWMGALVASVCFVVPGFVVMLTLTLLYTTFAAVSTLRGAFYGLAPVVLGIFAIAGYRLGRAAIKDTGQLAFAVASAIAMAFPQVGIVTVVLVAGSVAIMLYASRAWGAVLVAATLALALLALTSGVAM